MTGVFAPTSGLQVRTTWLALASPMSTPYRQDSEHMFVCQEVSGVLAERLQNIGDEVIRVFETTAHPYSPRRNATVGQFFRSHARMSR